MDSVLSAVVIMLLAIISLQDFKYRAISWFVVALLFAAILIIALCDTNSYSAFMKSSLINLCILSLQVFLAVIFFWVKNRKVTQITDVMIGKGDLLFLGILSFMFCTANLIGYYLLGLIITMTFALTINFVRTKSKMTEVPLAGFLSLVLIPFFLYKIFNPGFNFYDDYYFSQLVFTWKH
jgi:hypothetical protein